MNNDRGIIKWIPFNSLTEQKRMVESLLQEKQKIKKPILSLEQEKALEEKIIEALYEQVPITLYIYRKERITVITSTILSIDYTYKKIKLANQKTILFQQIVKAVL